MCGQALGLVWAGLVGGVGGSLLDSLLGATVQYSGWCETKKLVVNAPTPTSRHLSGFRLLDNHAVNFVAAATTSALGAVVAARVW